MSSIPALGVNRSNSATLFLQNSATLFLEKSPHSLWIEEIIIYIYSLLDLCQLGNMPCYHYIDISFLQFPWINMFCVDANNGHYFCLIQGNIHAQRSASLFWAQVAQDFFLPEYMRSGLVLGSTIISLSEFLSNFCRLCALSVEAGKFSR